MSISLKKIKIDGSAENVEQQTGFDEPAGLTEKDESNFTEFHGKTVSGKSSPKLAESADKTDKAADGIGRDSENDAESEGSESDAAIEPELTIIEGGGAEQVIEQPEETQITESDETPACRRNSAKDKKLADYGTYISAAIFLIAIVISIFNKDGFKYPVAFLIAGAAGFTMGLTNVLRAVNNKKCGCKTCSLQFKTFVYSAVLWFALFIAGLITFLVMTFK